MPEDFSESVRDELIAEIIAAFDGVSREDGRTLHEAMSMDNRESNEENRAARRFDTEKRWLDISEDVISWRSPALSHVCSKGFRYYLPAFLVYGLRHLEHDHLTRLGSASYDSLFACNYHLLYDYPNSLQKSEPENIANKYGFNNAQCTVIAKFLRFMIDVELRSMTELAEIQAVEKWERYVKELNSN